MDKRIIKIEDMQDPKPDGYNISAGCLLDLEFPFSFYFIDQIDSFKRYYEEELPKDYDKIDSKDHLKDFKYNLLTSIPQLKDSPFEWKWTSELYFNDFVTVIASRHAVPNSKCPNCGNTIGGIAITQAGYIGEPVNQTLNHSVRSLPSASYRILHLIVRALIGASASQPALAFLRKNNQTATDAERYCMDHIRNDWEILKNILNCLDELELLKHLLPIVKFVQILNSKLGYHLTRQNSKEMDFKTFLEKESDDDENHNSLKTAFDEFRKGGMQLYLL
ncbi:hypothetical protein RhiirC2_867096 [Rhizophagus irregularis]|uniref:Uncharacterized protein n=1 Tax=Rhizophagus irregularis TaxID=588596 RepID=A0A2N1N4E5_9GLOM|nr:hypothetical protein RhiirC2_867096 [Rhizophagus irregularis]